MRKILPIIFLAWVASGPSRGAEDASLAAANLERAVADAAISRAAAAATARAGVSPFSLTGPIEREVLAGDVARYRFSLRLGPGEHDVIRLHRIVRERSPWNPRRTNRGLMLAHGDAWGFDATFLAHRVAAPGDDSQSLAVFLATHGIDVWGIDFRWALVPGDTEDLSFMADWGFATSLEDLDTGLLVARFLRLATGSGWGRLGLLGFSRGGQIGWAQLSAETSRPWFRRHVEAFVAVDHTFKSDDPSVRESGCQSEASARAQIDAGTLATDFAVTIDIGTLALEAPDEPSPLFAQLSNAELAEFAGASPAGGAIPALHSVGGIVDPMTFETELLHSRPEAWFSFLASAGAFQPLAINRDGGAILCDQIDVPFDDGLGQIQVPIFYVGSVGGFGAFGLHTTTLVASPDVSSLLVDVPPSPEQGYGHNDLFLADGAEALVWQPILDWLVQR